MLGIVIAVWLEHSLLAAPIPKCEAIKLSKVRITRDCVSTADDCFIEFKAGRWSHHFPFRNESDGQREEFGFSAACEGTMLNGDARAINLPPGCEVSLNFGGEAGARGAQCVCRDDGCVTDSH